MVAGESEKDNVQEEQTMESKTSKLKMTMVETSVHLSNQPTHKKKFATIEVCLVLISLLTYMTDTLTDVLVGMQYFRDDQYMWGALTFLFVLLPSIIIQIFSARWYAADGRMKGCRAWLVHIFQLQPLERYLFVLVAGFQAKRSGEEDDLDEYYYRQNDACMLRLFEAFLESAPQLTLQLYIMLCTHHATWLTASSACISLLALGWAVAAYSHALRQAYRDHYRIYWPGLVLQTVWHMSMAAGRVLALVAFASVFKGWVFVILGIHWTLMTVWVVLQKTDFCPSRIEEYLFDGVVGIIYCFCFFNLKEGQTRYRMAAFYTLMLVENGILVGVWYPSRMGHAWYNHVILVMVFACFCLGLMAMLMYYRFCHPSSPILCCPKDDFPVYVAEVIHKQDQPENTPPKFMGPKKSSKVSIKNSKVSLAPQYTSTGQLPRRGLLKQITQMDVEFKEVASPSQLSPIKKMMDHSAIDHNVYTDCTLEIDESLEFQHYTVDASACFKEDSKCNTLGYSGVELSRAGHLDSVSQGNTVWKGIPNSTKLNRMRQFIQSTPLFAQHPRSRINEAKFNCTNSEITPCLTRLKFDQESDEKSPLNTSVELQTHPDRLHVLASPIVANGSACNAMLGSYSPTASGDSSPVHQGDSGHGTDASLSDKNSTGSLQKLKPNLTKISPKSDKMMTHPSMDSVELRETALIKDTNTL